MDRTKKERRERKRSNNVGEGRNTGGQTDGPKDTVDRHGRWKNEWSK